MGTDELKGSFYIRARKANWYVCFQAYENGNRKQKSVAKIALHSLGFNQSMSVFEAKLRCSILNRERNILKSKMRIAGKRIEEKTVIFSTLFAESEVGKFESILRDENFGSEKYLQKLYSHFLFVQKLCVKLNIQPHEYRDNSKRIYKYLIEKKISVSYGNRLISILNRWGRFKSKQAKSFYEEVESPRGRERSAIAEAQLSKRGVRTELGVRSASLPLREADLLKVKSVISYEQYNWLYLSVWLGLRPQEIDSLKAPRLYKIERDKKFGLIVLNVYQSKLMSIAEKNRWKLIPIIFSEQVNCLRIIESGNFIRPLCKTIQKHISTAVTTYGGRKGFVDLMLLKGQALEDISMWLGHKTIATTWRDYKYKFEVNYTKTADTTTNLDTSTHPN